jgi:hypothetical protein
MPKLWWKAGAVFFNVLGLGIVLLGVLMPLLAGNTKIVPLGVVCTFLVGAAGLFCEKFGK